MGVPRTRTQASKSAKCLPRRMAGCEAPDRKLHKLAACSESSHASESPSGSPYQCGPVHSLPVARTVRPRLPGAGPFGVGIWAHPTRSPMPTAAAPPVAACRHTPRPGGLLECQCRIFHHDGHRQQPHLGPPRRDPLKPEAATLRPLEYWYRDSSVARFKYDDTPQPKLPSSSLRFRRSWSWISESARRRAT